MTPKCGNYAFQYDPIKEVWANSLSGGTDILLTHGPLVMDLDQGKWCKLLLQEVCRARPMLVVFGHIHRGRGEELLSDLI